MVGMEDKYRYRGRGHGADVEYSYGKQVGDVSIGGRYVGTGSGCEYRGQVWVKYRRIGL